MSAFIRIFLRYLAAFLIARGYLREEDASLLGDPDLVAAIEIGLGVSVSAAVEGWYWIARKKGWTT